MKLVPAICTQCGAELRVDETLKSATCPYCNAGFVVEQAINTYSVNVHNDIHADVINVVGADVNAEIDKAEFYFETDNLDKALEHVNKAVEINPRDGKIWSLQSRILFKLNNLDAAEKAFSLAKHTLGTNISDCADALLNDIEESDFSVSINFINDIITHSSQNVQEWVINHFENNVISYNALISLCPDLDKDALTKTVIKAIKSGIKKQQIAWLKNQTICSLEAINADFSDINNDSQSACVISNNTIFVFEHFRFNDSIYACAIEINSNLIVLVDCNIEKWHTNRITAEVNSVSENYLSLNNSTKNDITTTGFSKYLKLVNYLKSSDAEIKYYYKTKHYKTKYLTEQKGEKRLAKIKKRISKQK